MKDAGRRVLMSLENFMKASPVYVADNCMEWSSVNCSSYRCKRFSTDPDFVRFYWVDNEFCTYIFTKSADKKAKVDGNGEEIKMDGGQAWKTKMNC